MGKQLTSYLSLIDEMAYLEEPQKTAHSEYSENFGYFKDWWRKIPCAFFDCLVNNDIDKGQYNYKQVEKVPVVFEVVTTKSQNL